MARLGGARTSAGRDGLVIASEWRGHRPRATAFTIGDVIVTRLTLDELARRPTLTEHEARHAEQWARWAGLPFLPAYAVASFWSLLRTGDPASRNAFERAAGLVAGGYVERPLRHGRQHTGSRRPSRV